MKTKFYVTIILASTLIACKVTDKSVVGNYSSNYQEKLTLNSDKTFIIDYDILDTVTYVLRWPTKVTGHWALKDKSISLVVDDKKYNYWECFSLGVKRKKLKRPNQCGPTHRFTIFTKTTK